MSRCQDTHNDTWRVISSMCRKLAKILGEVVSTEAGGRSSFHQLAITSRQAVRRTTSAIFEEWRRRRRRPSLKSGEDDDIGHIERVEKTTALAIFKGDDVMEDDDHHGRVRKTAATNGESREKSQKVSMGKITFASSPDHKSGGDSWH